MAKASSLGLTSADHPFTSSADQQLASPEKNHTKASPSGTFLLQPGQPNNQGVNKVPTPPSCKWISFLRNSAPDIKSQLTVPPPAPTLYPAQGEMGAGNLEARPAWGSETADCNSLPLRQKFRNCHIPGKQFCLQQPEQKQILAVSPHSQHAHTLSSLPKSSKPHTLGKNAK